MSLATCLKKLGTSINEDDAARIKEIASKYRHDGMGSTESAKAAARDVLSELFEDRKGYVATIEEQGGVAPKRSDVAGVFTAEDEGNRSPADQPIEDDSWLVTKGLKAGIDQTQALGGGLMAAAGDALGVDSVRDYGMEVYNRNMEEAGQNATPGEFTDIDSLGDAADWALWQAGNLIPTMGTVLLGGGVGGVAARQGAKQFAQGYIKDQIAAGMSKQAAIQLAAKATAKKFATRETIGQAAGAYAAGTGLETGSIYGETGDAGVSFAHGAIAGAVEALPMMNILNKFGLGKAAKEQIKRSVLKEAGKQSVLEGSTEALQTLIEQHAAYWVENNGESLLNNLGEANTKEIINAAAAGALGGSVFGGGGQALANRGGIEPSSNPSLNDQINTAEDQAPENAQGKIEQGEELFSVQSGGEMPGKGLTVEETQKVVDEFLEDYNGHIPLDAIVKETQEDIYGPDATYEKAGRIMGAYHGGLGAFTLAARSLRSTAEARKTLRHEVLGHYGLNTFTPADKKALLDEIIASKRGLSDGWKTIENDKYYTGLSESKQAEEVFAHIIEKPDNLPKRILDKILSLINKGLRNIGLLKTPTSQSELRELGRSIASGIRAGERPQQTFSKDDSVQFSRESNNNFQPPIDSMTDKVLRTWQDKFQPVLGTQKEILGMTGETNLDEDLDVYRAEEAFHGKTENDLRLLKERFIEPLAADMAEHKISREELDKWLMAKHAQERNAQIAKINPEMPDGGSGMTNQEAEQVLEDARQEGKETALDDVAEHIYSMLRNQRQLMREGLQEDDITNAWESTYKHYVPLKGIAEDEQGGMHIGRGFDIRGSESKRALGRKSKAESPVLHAIRDTTEATIRFRKNEVGNVLLDLVETYPNQDYWEIFTEESPDTDRKLIKNKDGETVLEGNVNMASLRDEYFATKREGKKYYIKLKDPRLMRSMQNMGPESMNVFLRGLNTMTRFLSAVNTSYNPEFMVSNASRDIQTAVINLMAEQDLHNGKAEGKQLIGKMVKSVPMAMRAIHASLYNKQLDGSFAEWQEVFDQFREDGAKTGWFDSRDMNEQAKKLEHLVSIAQGGTKGNILKFSQTVKDMVEHANSAVENGVRLSVYKHAIDAGVSRKRAASLAKNLTINFNRKGEIGQTLNSLYMFSNASIQGVAVFARAIGTLKTDAETGKKSLNAAQKLASGLVGASFMLALLNREMAGEDDDGVNWYDKVPSHVRERNLVIMKSVFGGPEQDFYTIPLPYGYNIFHVLGDTAESAINSDYRGGEELSVHVVMSILGSFSPIGFESSKEAWKAGFKTGLPTVASPFIQLAFNENFYGSPIRRENFPFGTQKPASALVKRSTKDHWKAITDFLNDATGGSAYRSGYIDINPDALNHLFSFTFGGAGDFVSRSAGVVEKGVTGQELQDREIPFYRKLNNTVQEYDDTSLFYERANEIKQFGDELKALKGPERSAFKRENASTIRLLNMVKGTEKRLRGLRKMRKAIEANTRLSDTVKEARLETIQNKMDATVDKFNKRYDDMN